MILNLTQRSDENLLSTWRYYKLCLQSPLCAHHICGVHMSNLVYWYEVEIDRRIDIRYRTQLEYLMLDNNIITSTI